MDHLACSDCRELISGFVDGELSHDERARMSAHLATCAECREILESYRLIGSRIRSMPAVPPPDHLIDAIFAETIDAQPRRLFFVTSRLGYSLAAVAAVMLIFVVGVYLIVGGYQRGIQPQVTASAPGNGDTWPIQRPIEIKFNKSMNHASVEQAIAIIPEEEDQRLTRTWHGNTLVIGENQSLLPATNYQVLISGTAVDAYGNKLGADFRLSFGTTSTVQVPEPATPEPTAPGNVTPTRSSTPTVSASVATATPATAQQHDAATATSQPAPSATADSGAGTGHGDNPEGTPPAETATTGVEPTPTATDEADPTRVSEPTSTSVVEETPQPTETPRPPATATATLPPSPTPTATVPAPTATSPAPTPTETTIPVTGGFGDVYWGDGTIRERLGLPLAPAASTGALQLGFQGGTMYYRGDTATIYVLNASSLTWGSFMDTSTSAPEPQPGPDGYWIPGGVLGYLWAAEQSVQDEMGYAIQQYPASFSAQVQEFEGGVMLSSPGIIWVVYNDLTYDWFNNSGA